MLFSNILGTAIFLFFIYLILSLITISLLEYIQNFLRLRSNFLEDVIEDFLHSPRLARMLFDHPLVRVLSGGANRKPSYIPADIFSSALFDILSKAAQEAQDESAKIASRKSSREVFEFETITGFVKTMDDNPQLRDLLLVILNESEGSLAKARLALEDVYNKALDSASGYYRRRVQGLGSIVALLVALLLNIDTIILVRWGLNGFVGQIPIGWNLQYLPSSLFEVVSKILGIMITAAVVASMAPFWFSVGRLIVQRLSTRPRREREIAATIDTLTTTKSEDVQKLAATQIRLLYDYHKIVLDQSRKSFWSALIAAVVGLFFFLSAIGFLLYQGKSDAALYSALAGALVEVISGINFYLYSKTTVQLAEFQNRLDVTQRLLLANSICENLEGEVKQTTRSKLVLTIAEKSSASALSVAEKEK